MLCVHPDDSGGNCEWRSRCGDEHDEIERRVGIQEKDRGQFLYSEVLRQAPGGVGFGAEGCACFSIKLDAPDAEIGSD